MLGRIVKKMKNKYFVFIFICLFIFTSNVKANSYSANVDVTYSTSENRLFNLAVNQGMAVNDKLIIFRSDNYNYYAIYSKSTELTGNSLKMTNSKVLHYWRYDNYNSQWYFDVKDESNTTITLNSYSLGNIKNSSYIFNFNDLQDFTYRYYSILLLMLLGILFFFRCFRK